MNNRVDFDYKKFFHRSLIIVIVSIWLGFNYNWLQEYISSNTDAITNYTGDNDTMQKNRHPAVAGLFYPSSGSPLNKMIEGFLEQKTLKTNTQPKILIVPHAGYKYSASIAASAYKELLPYQNKIKNVIVVGPAHRIWVEGAALSSAEKFITPLGPIEVNKKINEEISSNINIAYNDEAHKKEHSIEVQLPFLQTVLKKFTIVPLVYGGISAKDLASYLAPYIQDEQNLIIISADMSHYLDYEKAKEQDAKTAELIKSCNSEIKNHMSCGSTGINAAMIMARQYNLIPKLLETGNSGDSLEDKSSVVGYASWVFTNEDTPQKKQEISTIENELKNLRKFADSYGAALIAVAQKSIQDATKNEKYVPEKEAFPDVLYNKGASFITLKKDGELRGCIGSLVPYNAIVRDVASNAYKAATEDERFSSVSAEELSKISITISLLTNFEQISHSTEEELLQKIVPQEDGLIIRDGNRQGVFLPSVWRELPKVKDFLNQLKIKAGLSPNYWSENMKVYRFYTVEIKENAN